MGMVVSCLRILMENPVLNEEWTEVLNSDYDHEIRRKVFEYLDSPADFKVLHAVSSYQIKCLNHFCDGPGWAGVAWFDIGAKSFMVEPRFCIRSESGKLSVTDHGCVDIMNKKISPKAS